MKLPIILTTLLSTFASTVPNLCDVVYLDALGMPITDGVGQTLARYCEWSGPDVPTLDSDVCCTIDDDGAACSKSDDGKCPAETTRWYCEHGAEDALGGVTCYQPFPDACGVGMCVDAPEEPPTVLAFVMCCGPGGACQHVDTFDVFDCEYELAWCDYGYMDGNGVVDCWG